jgi:hypothetical protein
MTKGMGGARKNEISVTPFSPKGCPAILSLATGENHGENL